MTILHVNSAAAAQQKRWPMLNSDSLLLGIAVATAIVVPISQLAPTCSLSEPLWQEYGAACFRARSLQHRRGRALSKHVLEDPWTYPVTRGAKPLLHFSQEMPAACAQVSSAIRAPGGLPEIRMIQSPTRFSSCRAPRANSAAAMRYPLRHS